MTSKCLRVPAVALVFAAWVMPFMAMPLHLYCAHSYHEDCPACRNARLKNPHSTCWCCCSVCLAEASSSRTFFSKRPPEHNHELCDPTGFCSICRMFSTHYRICLPRAAGPFSGEVSAVLVPESRVRICSGVCSCYFGRAPPVPSV